MPKRKILLTVFCWLLLSSRPAWAAYADGFLIEQFPVENFQNSTVLSIAFTSGGQLYASNGIYLASVPLNLGETASSESLRPPLAYNSATNDIIFDSAGNLYITQFNNSNLILRRAPGGIFETFASGFDMVRELYMDDTDALYVLGQHKGQNNGYLRKIDKDGAAISFYEDIYYPWDIDEAADGTLFILTHFGEIYTSAAPGVMEYYATVPRPLSETLVVGPDGYLFVGANKGASGGINRSSILRLSPSKEWHVLAEDIENGGIPIEMEFGSDGHLYVANFQPGVSNLLQISGNFSGTLPDNIDTRVPAGVPEPSTLIFLLISFLIVLGIGWIKRNAGYPTNLQGTVSLIPQGRRKVRV